MTEINTRYPGTQSFESSQRRLFFGRDNDIDKLTKMIELERMVLVYAKSGIGKTSLINAGVLPALEEKANYSFHKIRLGAWKENSPTPHEIAAGTFAQIQNGHNYLDKIVYKDQSLWYFAKLWQQKQFQDEQAENKCLLLIFDQFEELFTYPEEQVIQFKKELAELLFTVVPQRFSTQKALLSEIEPGFLTETEESLLFSQPKVKILFAIRSDRMSQLNKMSDYIPRILLKHYELQPLTNQQAKDAICRPAQLDGPFSSPKFSYHAKALDEIMNFLTKDGAQKNNIESFQLQILCSVVEARVKEKNLPEVLAQHIVPVRDIYQNYYDNLVQELELNEDLKLQVKVMIEDGLIEEATQRRLQLSAKQIEYQYHIKAEVLNLLINKRLLRTEERDNFSLYELAHDTLVEPILESRRIRREKEEERQTQLENERKLRLAKEQAEKERLEREKEKIENEKERKKQRKIIFLVGSVAVVALVAFVLAVFMTFRAYDASAQAQNAKLQAIGALNQFKESEVKRLKTSAKNQIAFGQYFAAFPYLVKADSIIPQDKEIDSLLNICKEKSKK